MQEIPSRLHEAIGLLYRIQRELGRGGMAVVYLADDLKHGRRVAIKVLDSDLGEVLGERRFLREIEIAARLSHPRIVPVLDSGSADGILYYVMPYIDGESLRDRLERENQLPVDEAVMIARQVAAALAHAHGEGVVHRDIKPGNILLTAGEAVVADFGIARALTAAGGTRVTQSGLVVGTPLYMSPEQASGGADPDARADVYSLGCVLYEMLAGEPPFSARTAQAVTVRKLSESAPDVRAARESVPAPLARVLQKALARVPADRYRTASEMADALARAMDPLSAGPAASGPIPRSTGWRVAAIGTAVALLAVTAAYVAGWATRDAAGGVGLHIEVPVEGRVEFGPQAVLSPDGQRLAYVSDEALWIRDLPGFEARRVSGSEGARMPFWSPDATEVGYVAAGRFWRAPAAGGESVSIGPVGIGLAGGAGATWTEDGLIVFATGATGLKSIPARAGLPRELVPLEPDEEDHHDPHALPGGRGILFVPHGREDIGTIDLLAGGERRVLLRLEGRDIVDPVYAPSGHILFARRALGLWAVPFSLRRLEVTGDPFLVLPGALSPSVGADGRLAFLRGPASPARQLAFVRRDGEVERRVGEAGAIQYFSVSGLGDRIAFHMETTPGLWVLDPVRGTRAVVTRDGEFALFPRWLPDDRRVAYSAPGSEGAIRIRAADGTGTFQELRDGWLLAFAPGGEFVFTLGEPVPDGDWDIGYLDPDSDGPAVSIVATGARECCPEVSPDGRYIAYVSDATGQWEVYLTRFPSGEGTWQVSSDGGAWPRWDRRGDRLYYARDLDIMEVPVSTGSPLQLGIPTRVFSRPLRLQGIRFGKPDFFDVTPDGERFLVVLPATSDGNDAFRITVIGDWRSLLER